MPSADVKKDDARKKDDASEETTVRDKNATEKEDTMVDFNVEPDYSFTDKNVQSYDINLI